MFVSVLLEVSRVVSVDALLDGHEVAVRAQVEQLRSQLTDAERVLEEVAITRRTLALVLAGPSGGARSAGPGRPAGPPAQVPVCERGMSGEVLPGVYRQVWSAVADSAEGLRSVQVCRVVGAGTGTNEVELMRSKLKRLVQRGWLAEPAPGLFRRV
ncbi:hypothetical protein ABH935_003827 [Catenulispora sp. GAS73]|uniref:hypothetical protein n=1 Tax=Catenulispora sp. GAS73 TaxID=3156269 RepID=UPI003515AAF9